MKPIFRRRNSPAARGGEGASIAQMYISRSLQGKSPDPNTARRRKADGLSPKIICPWLYKVKKQSHTQRGRPYPRPAVFILSQFTELRTEIHHIGNNINQIARSVNTGIAKVEDARRGLCLLDQVYELMYQIARK